MPALFRIVHEEPSFRQQLSAAASSNGSSSSLSNGGSRGLTRKDFDKMGDLGMLVLTPESGIRWFTGVFFGERRLAFNLRRPSMWEWGVGIEVLGTIA